MDSVLYPGVFGEGTALRYTPDLNGMKEDIILERKTDANRFSFLVRTDGLAIENNETDYRFVDEDGETVVQVGAIVMTDSRDSSSMTNAEWMEQFVTENAYRHIYEIETLEENQFYRVTMVVDPQYLENAVFPVTVDPQYIYSKDNLPLIKDVDITKSSSGAYSKMNSSSSVGVYLGMYSETRALIGFPNLPFNSWNYEINKAALWMYDSSNNITMQCWMEMYHCNGSWVENATVTAGDISRYGSDSSYMLGQRGVGGNGVSGAGFTQPGGNIPGGCWYNMPMDVALDDWKKGIGNAANGIMIKVANPDPTKPYNGQLLGTSFTPANSSSLDKARLIVDIVFAPVPGITQGAASYFITNTGGTRGLGLVQNSSLRYLNYDGEMGQVIRVSRMSSGYYMFQTSNDLAFTAAGNSTAVSLAGANALDISQHWRIAQVSGGYQIFSRLRESNNLSAFLRFSSDANNASMVVSQTATTWKVSPAVVWPVARGTVGADTVNSPWGWRRLNNASDFHGGIDIFVASKTVRTSMDGVIDFIDTAGNSSAGKYVRIKHTQSNGQVIYSYYMHMNSISVSTNQSVKTGQTIGQSGSTGIPAVGPHLHFALRFNNSTSQAVNPLKIYNWHDTRRSTNPNTNNMFNATATGTVTVSGQVITTCNFMYNLNYSFTFPNDVSTSQSSSYYSSTYIP
jgi:murein DD-endopeptidase MepM/ murein hydrolase activator NlpD